MVDRMIDEGALPNFRTLAGARRLRAAAQQQAAPEPDHLDHDRHRQAPRRARHRTLRRHQPEDRQAAPGHQPHAQGEGAVEHRCPSGTLGRGRGLVGDVARRAGQAASVVSDHTCYHFLFPDGAGGAAEPAGITYPAELHETIAALIRRPDDLTPADLAPFVDVSPEAFARPFHFDDDLSHFKWALATAADVPAHRPRAVAPRASRSCCSSTSRRTDSTAHLFGHLFRAQRPRRRAGGAAGDIRRHGRGDVPLRRRDRGRVPRGHGRRTTLIVLSDHGFALGELPDDPSTTRDLRRVSERFHRIDGILYLYGGGRAPRHAPRGRDPPRHRADRARAARREPAADMPGRVLTDGVRRARRAAHGRDFESRRRRPRRAAGRDAPAVDAAVARAPEEPRLPRQRVAARRPHPRQPRLRGRPLRRGRGDLRGLIRATRRRALHASLAGALGALGRLDEARRAAHKSPRARPAQPRGVPQPGGVASARARTRRSSSYRSALRSNPATSRRPTRCAPRRGTPTAAAASSEEQHAAARRARQQAATPRHLRPGAHAARPGRQLAPAMPLVYQYRSNVAYLKGDEPRRSRPSSAASSSSPTTSCFARTSPGSSARRALVTR